MTIADSAGSRHSDSVSGSTVPGPPYAGDSLLQSVSHRFPGGGAGSGSGAGLKCSVLSKLNKSSRSSPAGRKYRGKTHPAPSATPARCGENRRSRGRPGRGRPRSASGAASSVAARG